MVHEGVGHLCDGGDAGLGHGLQLAAHAFDDDGIALGEDHAGDGEAVGGFDGAAFVAVRDGSGGSGHGGDDDFSGLLLAVAGQIRAEVDPGVPDFVACVAGGGSGLAAGGIAGELGNFCHGGQGRGIFWDGRHFHGGELDFFRIVEAERLHGAFDVIRPPVISFAVEQPP